ncbi:MAG: LPP20 family lipoprotein [Rickettsiales bacterium]|nr:LPP20 family lipoprotein [Rickettsiales bacterium]
MEPIWYINPTQNNAEFIYGTAQGYTLSQATKLALADAAAKLMTTISASTSTLMQENNYDTYDEVRQKVSENIEKITFSNYTISKSQKINQNHFIEVSIPRQEFLRQQKQRLNIIKKKIIQLDQSSKNTNAINRRNNLLTINALAKEAELKLRILQDKNIDQELERLLKYQLELEKFTNKVEFYISTTNQVIKDLITKYLNKENIKISRSANTSKDQIILKISLEQDTHYILNNYITKTHITFKNIINNNVIASNKITLSGSSTINKKQSFLSSIKELDERLEREDILQIIGILN